MSDISDKISKILEDPESMKMLTEIAGSLMGDMGNSPTENKDEETHQVIETDEGTAEEAVTPAVNFSSYQKFFSQIAKKEDIENSIRLISALIPYMSKSRKGSAEYVIKILGALKFISNYNMNDISKLISLISK